MMICEWRGPFNNDEVAALHAEGFERESVQRDWWKQVQKHSLGWVCARDTGALIGFVNVAWDGADHAFLLDTLTTAAYRRQGVGTAVVAVAEDNSRKAGCEWLHVDFGPPLGPFYLDQCGFQETTGGLIALH